MLNRTGRIKRLVPNTLHARSFSLAESGLVSVMADNRKHRTVAINPERLAQLMRKQGWSIEQLAQRAMLSTGSVSAVLNAEHPVYWATAEKFRVALRLESIDQLLHAENKDASAGPARIREWLLESAESKWITASNQLQFRIWRLKHEHLPKLARGKCYDLQGMASTERDRCHASLLRHAEVCARIGHHPQIIGNLTTFEAPGQDRWWVIDEWISGPPLSELLRKSRLPTDVAMRISMEIAWAMTQLHAVGIIRRELSPRSILIDEESRRVVLTEFELAKLLDGSPTVSNDDWPVDPYRAPEASSEDVDQRADVFSWGRVTLHLLLGTLPEGGPAGDALHAARLPRPVETILLKSIAVSRRSRPTRFEDVISVLQDWKGSA